MGRTQPDPKTCWVEKIHNTKEKNKTIQWIVMSRVCSNSSVSHVAFKVGKPEGEVRSLCFDTVGKQALFLLILFLGVALCSLSPPWAQSCRHALRSGSFHVAVSAHMHRSPSPAKTWSNGGIFKIVPGFVLVLVRKVLNNGSFHVTYVTTDPHTIYKYTCENSKQ